MLNIIVPAYNEEGSVKDVLKELLNSKLNGRIIVIDDSSSDNTPHILSSFSEFSKNITVVLNKCHKGYAEVIKQGFRMTGSKDIIVVVSADCCDDVSLIKKMYEQACRGKDIVCASRYVKGGKRIGGLLLKSIGSRVVNKVLHCLTGAPCHDFTNSFKMFHKKVIDSIEIESRGFDIFAELTLKAYLQGFTIVEMPTIWRERDSGKSHFSLFKDGIGYLRWILYGLKYIVLKKRRTNNFV